MLNLLICHPATCAKCGRETECVRVVFWDDSISGLICWDDLQQMVREKSQHPEARKIYAQAHDAQLQRWGWTRTEEVFNS